MRRSSSSASNGCSNALQMLRPAVNRFQLRQCQHWLQQQPNLHRPQVAAAPSEAAAVAATYGSCSSVLHMRRTAAAPLTAAAAPAAAQDSHRMELLLCWLLQLPGAAVTATVSSSGSGGPGMIVPQCIAESSSRVVDCTTAT
jgi:hypothetical protein